MLYPNDVPERARKQLEACYSCFAEQDLAAAFKNLELCYALWTENESSEPLSTENLVFFEYFKGLIYLTAGREDMALAQFYACKGVSERLAWSSPDKALPYAGLGHTFFRLEEYEYALRSFLKVS
jgi:tetratricopeptide (TPR) repeat protein